MRISWPFTGRTSTLDEMGALLRARTGRGVVVAGDAGVGKTRLVQEALGRLEPGRYTLVQVGGTTADAAIPFGAFGHVLPVEGAALPVVNPLRWATESLRTLAERAPLLVAVDDAHLLDPTSAALVHHLVLQREATVLATVRTGAAAPDPVTALWKDDLARRLDLVPLSKAESQAVVEGALGGRLGASTALRLYHSTQGNLLFLRELVLAGLAEGRLAEERGVWNWEGGLPISPRLRELIEARLGTIGADEREVLEYTALGEPLGAGKLAALTSQEAVERAEERHLIASADAGRRLQLRTAHPLYGEVARVRAGPERVRERLADLAAILQSTGMRRHGDVLRVALWHLEAGIPVQADLLLAACGQAWMLHDMDLAVRCGRAALRAGGDAAATIRVAPVLILAGHQREAEEHLARIDGELMDERTRAGHASTRAFNLGMGLGELEAADRLLAGALCRTTVPEFRQELMGFESLGRLYSARFAEAAGKAAEIRITGPVTPRGTVLAAASDALRLMLTGALEEAVALSNEALEGADGWLDYMPSLVAIFSDARSAASLWAGHLETADRYIAHGEALFAEEHLSHVAATTSRSLRVEYCLLRGDVRRAVRWAHEAASHGSQAIWAISGHGYETLAYAAAIAGDAATAAMAVSRAEERRIASGRIFHWRADMASAWIRAASGDLEGAAVSLLEHAGRCGELSLRSYQMFALHDAVRLGAAAPARGPLEALTGQAGGPLVHLCARHAAAAADDDAKALDEVSRSFADGGMTLYAAEAAAQASRAYGRAGASREANAAATRAWLLAGNCAGARTPALAGLAAPELTARQLEIARLAAGGLGNREIAERLVLSVRTVANHLHAVYDRLGVGDRDELAGLLGPLSRPGR